MEKITLHAEPRTILGKKVKHLRKEGKLPGNLFGKDITSTAVQFDFKEFAKVFNQAGSTGVVEVAIEGKEHPVLISAIQLDPQTDVYLHADLLQVNLKDKITTKIPVVVEGEAPAEKAGTGTIINPLNEIEVEALPMDLPHQVTVDISELAEVGQSIQVKDIKLGDKVEVKSDPEGVIVLVQEVKVEAEPEPAAEGEEAAEPEVIAEKGETEEEAGEEDKKE